MSQDIQFSVGQMARNLPADVMKAQSRLLQLGYKIGMADGICGRHTIFAILSFQGKFLRFPDGRIDPASKSWKMLRERTGAPMRLQGIAGPSAPSTQMAQADYTRLVEKPAATSINVGLSLAGNKFLIEKFGLPRETFSQNDQPITNKNLLALMKTDSVGPFRAYGLGEALDSLRQVFDDIKKDLPDLYGKIGNAGMTVCRYQRGSSSKISNHSWGSAIDLTILGVLDKRGDDMSQAGLLMIAPYFNKHSWYWGAAFSKEDSMHFECSQSLLDTFKS